MAAGEVAVATLLVAFDVFLPTIPLLAMAALSLAARREGPASWGSAGWRGPAGPPHRSWR